MDPFTAALTEAIDRSGMRGDHIAKQIGTSANQLSQWKNGRRPVPAHYAPNLASVLSIAPESISNAYARIIEAGLHGDVRDASLAVPRGNIRIPPLQDFGRPGLLDDCYLLEVVAHRKLGTTPPEHCRWTLQPNAAMSPLIERDAVLLVDCRKIDRSDLIDGAIYVFNLWRRQDVRRIFIRRDHLLLAAQSPEADRIEVYDDDFHELEIHGTVVNWI